MIHKITLTDNNLYSGTVKMPKGFEILPFELKGVILESEKNNMPIKNCKSLFKLNTYIIDFLRIKYNLDLVDKEFLGNYYKPQEITKNISQINYSKISENPSHVMLYGIQAIDCFVRIHYQDLRSAPMFLDAQLKNNEFLFFPANLQYQISNMQTREHNFIQTITYNVFNNGGGR